MVIEYSFFAHVFFLGNIINEHSFQNKLQAYRTSVRPLCLLIIISNSLTFG